MGSPKEQFLTVVCLARPTRDASLSAPGNCIPWILAAPGWFLPVRPSGLPSLQLPQQEGGHPLTRPRDTVLIWGDRLCSQMSAMSRGLEAKEAALFWDSAQALDPG